MLLSRRMVRAGIVLETLLLLAGLGLLAEAFMSGTATYKFINAGQTAEGTITNVKPADLGFYVQFAISSGDQSIFEQDSLALGRQIGDRVPVIFDPANPAVAVVNSFDAIWFKVIGLALAGLVISIIGLRMRAARSL